MSRDRFFRAVVCHVALGSGVAIAVVACGGAVASTESTPDAGPTSHASGTPSSSTTAKKGPPPPPTDAAAPRCIDVEPENFDTSCSVDADCVQMSAGKFCDGQTWCMCAIAAINITEKASYDALMTQVTTELHAAEGGCFCPFFGAPHCVESQCRICGGAAGDCPDGG